MDTSVETVRRGETLEALVFPTPAGTMIQPANFRSRIWLPLLAAGKLRHRRGHDLRHSYASLLLADGAELSYVSEQLGHHSAAFTLKTYVHLMPRDRRHVVNRLDKLAPIRTPSAPNGACDIEPETAPDDNPLGIQQVS